MTPPKKTWRSTAWKVLAMFALLLIYGAVNLIIQGKIPPPGPERDGWLLGAFILPAALLGTAFVLFISEKTR